MVLSGGGEGGGVCAGGLLTCLNVSALSSLVYMVTAPLSSAPVGTVRLLPSGATGHAEGIARNTCPHTIAHILGHTLGHTHGQTQDIQGHILGVITCCQYTALHASQCFGIDWQHSLTMNNHN